MSGRGYGSKEMCLNHSLPQQDCVRADNGNYFAVYPGYCGVAPSLRKSNGDVRVSSRSSVNQGFRIPAYATNNSSNMGSKVQSFATWDTPSEINAGTRAAMNYSNATDPIPRNLY